MHERNNHDGPICRSCRKYTERQGPDCNACPDGRCERFAILVDDEGRADERDAQADGAKDLVLVDHAGEQS